MLAICGKYCCRQFRHCSVKTTRIFSSFLKADDTAEREYEEMCRQSLIPTAGTSRQSVLLIQPRVKWGKEKLRREACELKLAEAKALVETLPGWNVVEQITVSLQQYSMHAESLFGTGKLMELRSLVRSSSFTCVMLNIDCLSGSQHEDFYRIWNVPIFDRYNIVLQIFKTYAKTTEAKLQIGLAEIPYLKSRIQELHATDLGERDSHFAQQLDSIGGSGTKTYWQHRRELLRDREFKLRSKLKEYREQRRFTKDLAKTPEIAIVGYTNAGKTSLIRVLTQDKKLVPLNRLFATLESSLHRGLLNNKMPVIFTDTVGFISDLPPQLLASFEATLDSIRSADVLVHIRDISHPDTVAQKSNVLETLQSLSLPQSLLDHMVELCNKEDLLKDKDTSDLNCDKDAIFTSCTTLKGFGELNDALELLSMEATQSFTRTFRVPISGRHYDFLKEETAVLDVVSSEDAKFLFVSVIMTETVMRKFEALFGSFGKKANR